MHYRHFETVGPSIVTLNIEGKQLQLCLLAQRRSSWEDRLDTNWLEPMSSYAVHREAWRPFCCRLRRRLREATSSPEMQQTRCRPPSSLFVNEDAAKRIQNEFKPANHVPLYSSIHSFHRSTIERWQIQKKGSKFQKKEFYPSISTSTEVS